MSILSNANAMSTAAYVIGNSLRFQSASSQTLTRTFGSTYTDKTKSTFSVWLKRGKLADGNGQAFLYYNSGGSGGSFGFAGANSGGSLVNDCLSIGNRNATTGVGDYNLQTTALYRDPSAWYHIVIVFDTSQATASNRLKLYVNGEQVTSFVTASYPSLNYQTTALLGGNAVAHQIGYNNNTGTPNYSDFYLTEINWIDGQALTPASFGYNDPYTGVWEAEKYAGTYGTNGFYLPFVNGTSTTTLGVDYSGNNNNWALNNFTRSAGVSDCWMKDVPSGNGYGGSTPSSNYPVMNPLSSVIGGTTATITAGNLNVSSSSVNRWASSTIALPSSGKWYAECTCTANTNANKGIGVWSSTKNILYTPDGRIYIDGSQVATPATYTTNDVIGVGFDANTVTFYKNNVLQYTSSGLTFSDPAFFYNYIFTDSFAWNFGQRSFAYTPPTGFLPLCVANLPAPTILQGNQYMDATLYTGNGSTQTITNAGNFSPDLVWTKSRSYVNSHRIFDVIRGTQLPIYSNLTAAESTETGTLTAFNSNGFSLGSNVDCNTNAATYVAWQWDAGTSTVTNTSGTISSQVRANTRSGVSVVTYTGTGATATVGHGLGVAPKMIIIKPRNAVNNWTVYHESLGNTKAVYLDLTNASANSPGSWNNTSPTSSVITLGTSAGVNNNTTTYVAYCFAEITGFSKFGSYTGNGSADGPFVFLGFRPKFIMTKRTDSSTNANWAIHDTSRSTYNVAGKALFPNLSNAEDNNEPSAQFDLVSNGFKVRTTSDMFNGNNATYIYMAFAENPFNYSNAR